MAGVARLALGIRPLWHFSDWTGVLRMVCWYLGILLFHITTSADQKCIESSLWFYVFISFRQQARLNRPIWICHSHFTSASQITLSHSAVHILYITTVAAAVKFAGDQVAPCWAVGPWDDPDPEMRHFVWENISSQKHDMPFYICEICHNYNNWQMTWLSEIRFVKSTMLYLPLGWDNIAFKGRTSWPSQGNV